MDNSISESALAAILLPGVPVEVLERYRRAAGDEIGRGKFNSPQSSAALAANTFGFFMNRQSDLPAFPRWTWKWSPLHVVPEEEVRFPWTGGHHPWLDVVVETNEFLIGVESKRYEPFDAHSRAEASAFSEAYWRDEWGNTMHPYQWVRDGLAHRPHLFRYVNGAQLVKHAFGLRTQASKKKLQPVLVYLYAQPRKWPGIAAKTIAAEAHTEHAEEVRCFARMVADGEVQFQHYTYSELLQSFEESPLQHVRDHAARLRERFDIG